MAEEKKAARAVNTKREFALLQMLQTAGLLDYNGQLLNPADRLASKDPYEYHPDVWRLYQAMMTRDGQVYALSGVATQAVLSIPYVFDFGEDLKSPSVKLWEDLDAGAESVFAKLRKCKSRAFAWGIALGEVIWDRINSLWMPVDLIPIPPWWYSLDVEGKPHKIDPETYQPEKDPMAETNYVLFVYDGDLERPYGRGWLELCYRPYLKKLLIDYNKLEMFQRFINPKAVVTGADKKQVEDAIADLTDKMADDVIGLHGKDLTITPFPVDGKGANEVYGNAWDSENRELAKIIIGAVLVTEEPEHSTRAAAVVQLDPFMARTFERAKSLEASEQTDISNWTRWILGEKAMIPDYSVEAALVEDLKTRAEVDEKLMMMGWEPPPGYFGDKYDRPEMEMEGRLEDTNLPDGETTKPSEPPEAEGVK